MQLWILLKSRNARAQENKQIDQWIPLTPKEGSFVLQVILEGIYGASASWEWLETLNILEETDFNKYFALCSYECDRLGAFQT